MDSYRGFHWLSKSWYADACRRSDVLDEVTIGLYSETGGTSGEFCVRWTLLGGKSVPQLQVFDDAWAALQEFRDVLDALAKVDNENISPEKLVEILRLCGIQDETEYDCDRDVPGLRPRCKQCGQAIPTELRPWCKQCGQVTPTKLRPRCKQCGQAIPQENIE